MGSVYERHKNVLFGETAKILILLRIIHILRLDLQLSKVMATRIMSVTLIYFLGSTEEYNEKCSKMIH